VVHILSEPDVRAKFNQAGNFAVTSTPEEFAAFIWNEAGRWGEGVEGGRDSV